MPLFNNAAIAASFKATSTLATTNTTNGNNAKKTATESKPTSANL
jgi:hypothetical protein